MEDRTPLKMRGGGGSRQIDDACAGKGGTLTLDQASAVQCSAACTCVLVRVSQSRAVSLLLHLCARERERERARVRAYLFMYRCPSTFAFWRISLVLLCVLPHCYINFTLTGANDTTFVL